MVLTFACAAGVASQIGLRRFACQSLAFKSTSCKSRVGPGVRAAMKADQSSSKVDLPIWTAPKTTMVCISGSVIARRMGDRYGVDSTRNAPGIGPGIFFTLASSQSTMSPSGSGASIARRCDS